MGIRGGAHQSEDPREHFCVRGFRQNGHAYKTLHIYSNAESRYFRKSGGPFRVLYGNTLDLSLECENLGYVIFTNS